MIDTIWCKILSSIYNSLPYLQWVTWAFNGTLTLVSCGSDFRCSWLGSSWLRMAQLKHGGNQHTDIQKQPEPWSKKWSCMTHDMAASNSASKSIQINSNELPWLSFTIPLTKTWTLASFWSSDPLGCSWVWASWQKKQGIDHCLEHSYVICPPCTMPRSKWQGLHCRCQHVSTK